MLTKLKQKLGFHPRAWWHAVRTYARFMGKVKPALMGAMEDEAKARFAALQTCTEPSRLKAPLGKRLLVISPHPDDESIGCGGALLAHRGIASVHLIHLFNGEGGGEFGGPWRDTPEYKARLVSERRRELAKAAEELGCASAQSLDLPDGYADPTEADVRRLRDMVNAIRPDVVFIPWYLDNLADHRMANILFAAACPDIECMVLGFEVWALCPVNAIFDLGTLLPQKEKLVAHFRSQTQSTDYVGYVRALAQMRGFLHAGQSGKHPAEAYFALPNRVYGELVRDFYGVPGKLTKVARDHFGFGPPQRRAG